MEINLTPNQEKRMIAKGYSDPVKYLNYLDREREASKLRKRKTDAIRKSKNLMSYYWNDVDSYKNRSLINNYGITLKQYDSMFESQNGLCAICKKPESKTTKGVINRLSVDHNHSTGEVRSLLCDKCNRGIGFFNEDIECLSNAISYLSNWFGGAK
ncbi:endonuclease VII domain-containing protein [Enterobacter mori]|uniref:endonuclease VII domain-containing protein n=1 Tax=Enterobacter mori TaxID=539813 RepID=UPI00398A8F36